MDIFKFTKRKLKLYLLLSYTCINKLQKAQWWLPGTGVCEKWEDVGQKIQTSSCKMNKFWKPHVQHRKYS